MTDCTHVTRDMLTHPIDVRIEDSSVDFFSARVIADRRARELAADPMLLAWFDRKSRKFSPDTICCDRDKPSWLVYGESHGGDITVDINNEDYVFVYFDAAAES
jgi:hypothetical protein